MAAADVVREFCAAIDRKDLAAVEALLDEDVVYHNIGTEPAVGREATLAAVKFQFDMFEPIAFRLRNLATDGAVVLTERVDEVTANGITAPVPVMGAFENRAAIESSTGATTSTWHSPASSCRERTLRHSFLCRALRPTKGARNERS